MKSSRNKLFIATALAALFVPISMLHAQGGGRGAAGIGHNPPPTSPVTGNAATGKPLASASISTMPNVSVREGNTNTSALA